MGEITLKVPEDIKDFIDDIPHHKHIDNKAEPSEEKDLRDVLDFIRNFLM